MSEEFLKYIRPPEGPAVKTEIHELFQTAPKRLVQIGETLHIFIGEDPTNKVGKAIQRGLNRGEAVIEKGVTQWVEFWPVSGPGKSGSERYVWKSDKVQCEKRLFIKQTSSSVTYTILGKVWRDAKDVL